MKHAALLALTASLLAGCDGTPTAVPSANVVRALSADVVSPLVEVAEESRPSAKGHANVTTGGELTTVSFHARERKDGTAEGSVELHNGADDSRIHADIDCLLSIETNEAIIQGPITKSNDPLLVGLIVGLRVTDNGEGAKDPDDTMGFTIGVNAPDVCDLDFDPLQVPIEGGNIQVKP